MQVDPVSSYTRSSRRQSAAPHYSRNSQSARSDEPKRSRRTDAPRSADKDERSETKQTEDRPRPLLSSAVPELSLTTSNAFALHATQVRLNSFDFSV